MLYEAIPVCVIPHPPKSCTASLQLNCRILRPPSAVQLQENDLARKFRRLLLVRLMKKKKRTINTVRMAYVAAQKRAPRTTPRNL